MRKLLLTDRRLARPGVLGLAAVTAVSLVFATAAGARQAANPCAGLNAKKVVAQAEKIVGADTVAQLDSEHPNECDYFSSTTGREARIYTWPKSQQASAVGEILSGTFAGRTVKKVALSGLGPGAVSYAGDPAFVAGSKFVVLFPYNLTNAQTLKVARIIYAALG